MLENKFHQKIITSLDGLSQKVVTKESQWVRKYLGTNKQVRSLKTSTIQSLSKEYFNKIPSQELIQVIDSLYSQATTFEEIDIAAKLVGHLLAKNYEVDLEKVEYWLGFVSGWAETDVLCQSNFSSKEILNNWNEWKTFLDKLSTDSNIHRRRASLVLLTKTLRQTDDPRVLRLALHLVTRLKNEKEILITKAVSWILRSAVKHHSLKVEEFIINNQSSLPKIAYRETLAKLKTGRKTQSKKTRST